MQLNVSFNDSLIVNAGHQKFFFHLYLVFMFHLYLVFMFPLTLTITLNKPSIVIPFSIGETEKMKSTLKFFKNEFQDVPCICLQNFAFIQTAIFMTRYF